MLKRTLAPLLGKLAQAYPVVTLTGPRQSGKTTLVRAVFRQYDHMSLEDPDFRTFASEDPRGFLDQFTGPVVLDEIQRTPNLFSYIQTVVDEDPTPGRFVLTGSQDFLLLRSISQSLAGRTAILHLLPFSWSELQRRSPIALSGIGRVMPRRKQPTGLDLMNVLFTGFYPRIHDRQLEPGRWLADYYLTYVERDVRQVENVGDLEAFGRFVRLCAGRNGQLLNLSSLGNDAGISHVTAKRWLSILESSCLIKLLRPHHHNFSKRLVKRPKLYFLDSGLLCYLLRIRSPDDLRMHASRGSVFESFILSEFVKNYVHHGLEPDVYFWRDSAGHEIDVLLESGSELLAVEIKSGQTIAADFFSGLEYWRRLVDDPKAPAALIYGGDRTYKRRGINVYSWSVL
ncbi:MAG: ATP-binding protein [Gemmatimonadales bacterium]